VGKVWNLRQLAGLLFHHMCKFIQERPVSGRMVADEASDSAGKLLAGRIKSAATFSRERVDDFEITEAAAVL
jgi:hypothetical protein